MRNLSLWLVLACLAPLTNFAQLSTGSIAPDLTFTDIDGVTHDLYGDYLDQGKSVVLDLSATWCPPCWSFHNNGVMEDLYDDYGPNSSEYYVMPMMIEVDPSTNLDCFFGPTGCNGSTLGDWSGHPFPLGNPISSEASDINNDFSVSFYPTLYMIAPSGYTRLAPSGSNTSYSVFESWVAESYQMENSTWTVIEDDCELGEIDFNTVQGHDTVTYNWSNGATTEDVSGLTTGDYSVTLTDSNGYTVEFGPISVVGEEQMEEDNATLTHIDCQGNATGSISISITGGTGNYAYEWSNGSDDGPSISDLLADDYEVTITDKNTACELELEYELEEPDELEVELEITNAGCGGAMGEVEFDIDGGVYPYEIIIDNNVYTATTIALSPGSYSADIVDGNECLVSRNFSITTFPLPTAMSSVSGVIDCSQPSVLLSNSGSSVGTEITYAWYDDNGDFLSNNSTYQASEAGSYTLYVTNNTTNCFSTSEVDVVSNLVIPTAIITPSGSLTCNSTTMTLSAAGSSAGTHINYRWTDNNGGNIVGSNTVGIITIDSGGDYTLLVEDESNSCENSVQVSITENTTPPVLSVPSSVSYCTGESNQICATVLPNQTIEWRNQSGIIVCTSNCLTFNTSETFTATLVDNATGCSNSSSFVSSANLLPSSYISGNLEFCDGGSTVLCHQNQSYTTYNWIINGQSWASANCITLNQSGQVTLTAIDDVTGCMTSQSYSATMQTLPTAQLSTPEGTVINCNTTSVLLDLEIAPNTTTVWTDASGSVIANNEDISVGSGNYYYTVQSNLGCQTQGSISITEDTSLPELILLTPETLTCSTSQTTLSFNTTSSNYTLVWFDAFGNILNGENPVVTSPGIYYAELTEVNGCKLQQSITVTEDLGVPSISIPATNMLDCNTPSVTLQIEGDILNNAISWSNEQGIVIGSAAAINVTEPGNYTAIVTSPNGCSAESSIIITASNELPEISIPTPEKLGCLMASVELVLEGELDGNTYNWINEQGQVVGVNATYLATSPGIYIGRIITSAGCESEKSIAVEESEIVAVQASFDFGVLGNSVQLNNNTADAIETTFLWEFGDGNTSTDGNLASYIYQDAGQFELCLSTTNECGTSKTCQSLVITAALSYTASVQDISCPGGTDGSIVITMMGGTPMFSYEWNDPNISGMGAGNLSAGDYQVTVTDADGSILVIEFTLTEPNPIVVEATITETSMMNANGQISLNINGGTAPYEVMWDDGSEGMERAGLEQGNYMAVITDESGCQVVSSFKVTGSTNITEIQSLQDFRLSPNPSSNEVYVEAKLSEELKLDISLINARGEKLFEEKLETDAISRQLDLSTYPSGVYLLELRSGQQVSYRKLIITK